MDYGLTQSQVGVSAKETETQIVAREFEANIVEFDNLEQMQRNLTSGNIGQVLVDRNTAFHFLDKSGLKRNRQIRLIRNIDYPMDYFLAFTKRDSSPLEIAGCGPTLKELQGDLVSVAKSAAQERLIPAEMQSVEYGSLFSSESQMTRVTLFYLLGIFGALSFLSFLVAVYNRYSAAVRMRSEGNATSTDLHDVSLNRRNHSGTSKENSLMQNFLEMEKNLNELIGELQKMKEEYASTIADGGASQHNRQKSSQETTFPDLHGAFDTGNLFVLDEKEVRDEESSKNEQRKARHGKRTEEESYHV